MNFIVSTLLNTTIDSVYNKIALNWSFTLKCSWFAPNKVDSQKATYNSYL